ncbi:hypothetical protein KMW28_12420 [Flammeovirga yaeyamensis]|uniref:Phage protein n=1 Tax=Flammeovirga yaeyamensis TaxID=367791 RepID=A0AAX1N3G1_9BACT|nr:hypothetical protein [Flammeovirga yaeyamensis]MBB3696027.1 late competence protein required for DNA uptake (superfamily II DNA/RNA helicase) [Flammeovirga yaeyamensis]NMF34713.1 hypothetical protein [Flammeovirga yaeyamensis]QWG00458.1 hypothetical protein KMW28_12420 [Flammeovirga yaeyamensis]
MRTITITDESITGDKLNELLLEFQTEYITVKELIEARVREEVKKVKQNTGSYNKGLVLPSALEQKLNRKKVQKIDYEKQVYIALDAFMKNGYFILIDKEQAETLDQKFHIDNNTKVSFIKLTPLIGG